MQNKEHKTVVDLNALLSNKRRKKTVNPGSIAFWKNTWGIDGFQRIGKPQKGGISDTRKRGFRKVAKKRGHEAAIHLCL